MWESDHKEGWEPKNCCFWTVVLEKLFRVPWTARKRTTRRSNQSILKEIKPEYSLEGPLLKLTFQYFGHLMGRSDPLEKTLILAKIEGRRRGQQRTRWHHQLNGHEFEQAREDNEGQGSLACCSPWGCKESDTTEWLNDNKTCQNMPILPHLVLLLLLIGPGTSPCGPGGMACPLLLGTIVSQLSRYIYNYI